MSCDPISKAAEIDRNFERFLQLLPAMVGEHDGENVLMRHGDFVGFHPTPADAQIAGNRLFPEDGLFSFQHVTETPEYLGQSSYAVSSRTA